MILFLTCVTCTWLKTKNRVTVMTVFYIDLCVLFHLSIAFSLFKYYLKIAKINKTHQGKPVCQNRQNTAFDRHNVYCCKKRFCFSITSTSTSTELRMAWVTLTYDYGNLFQITITLFPFSWLLWHASFVSSKRLSRDLTVKPTRQTPRLKSR